MHRSYRTGLTLVAVLTTLAVSTAWADSGRSTTRTPVPAAYQQECSACHIAYPPAMLGAESWKSLMGHLGKHFGIDASLDATTTQELTTWLTKNAGNRRIDSDEPRNERITRTAWFLRQHRVGEVPADAWKRHAVRSPANCGACHPRADRGDFDEDEVRIPK